MSKEVLLDVRHLTQQFHLTKKIKVKAVDDVSFQIHKGEIFGLVGESGSGKSTVARCLMNIYQPAQGEIWYKDVNICDKKEFKKHKKMLQTRRQMIFQDSASSLNQKMKVSDIITEPMRIQHITPPRGSFVKEAAFQMEYVGLENSFLDRYPSELSGGQRQRLTIARALVRQPEILILDDSASALDYATDAALRKAIRNMEGNPAVFIVSQRTSSIQHADRILVLDDGKAAGLGTHEELLETCPVYQEIYYSQFDEKAAKAVRENAANAGKAEKGGC